MRKQMFFIFTILLMVSCSAGRIVRFDSENIKKIDGTVSFVGFQVPDPVECWFENVGKGGSRHCISFNQPEQVFIPFLSELSPEIRGKVAYQDFDNKQLALFNEHNLTEGNEIKYSQLSNFITIYDSPDNNNNMDDYCLSNLNKYIGADYYLLAVGDIEHFQPWKSQTGKSMVPQISIVIYDKNGTKVFVKNYKQVFTEIPEDIRQAATCYQYMVQTIVSNQANILNDLQVLVTAKNPQGKNLEKIYEQKYMKTQKLAKNDK